MAKRIRLIGSASACCRVIEAMRHDIVAIDPRHLVVAGRRQMDRVVEMLDAGVERGEAWGEIGEVPALSGAGLRRHAHQLRHTTPDVAPRVAVLAFEVVEKPLLAL